ncbi:MAG: PD-(D/E)XK nuclease family protein [Acidimicrobiales bacterium]
MIAAVEEVRYGRPASAALARAVIAAKGGRVLAPVTVVVASNFVGLGARWLLGSGALGLSGVANVSFVTPLRLAQLLGAEQLLDRRALTNPVLGAAVRGALAVDPGPYAAVADHPATEAALVALHRELATLDPAARSAVAAHDQAAAAAVRLHDAVLSRLSGFHDEAQLAAAAAARPGLGLALASFGQFIWYLPAPMSGPFTHLLSILFGVAPTRVIVGLTGHEEADQAVRRVVRLAGVGPAAPTTAPDGPPSIPRPARVISVSDPDEEVRWVVRQILTLLALGGSADRIAVLYPVPHPYLGLLSQHLAAAAIPFNGPARRPLSDSAAGRTLLGALALPAQHWRRDRVIAVLSGAPLRQGSHPVPAVAWDRHSRDAGVVAGLEDWTAKLTRYRHQLQADGDGASGAGDAGRAERRTRDAESVAALQAYIEQLAELIDGVHRAESWAAKSQAATRLVEVLLGRVEHWRDWPDHEVDAAEAVQTGLGRLAELDSVDPQPGPDSFYRALSGELDRSHGRQGRFGQGVLFGPLSAGVGLDLDAVFLLGGVEGICPAPRRLDSLLSEGARAAAGGQLAGADDRRLDQHRAWLAAVAAAPAGRASALVPRGDLRRGRRTQPSRFVLEGIRAATDRLITVTEFDHLGAPLVDVVASHAEAVLGAHQHAHVGDRDLVELAAARAAGVAPHNHPLAARTGGGLLALHLRAGDTFSAFDGNVAGQTLPMTADSAPLAATRLEDFAECGFRYLLAHVLGLRERDDPERVVQLSALDRGSALHLVLERFSREALAVGAPAPDQRWSEPQRQRLMDIAGEVFDEIERRGRTGRPVLWQLERERLHSQLQRFLDHDNGYRSQKAARPEAVELAFGMDGEAPLELCLPDGRSLRFRGRADRVDRLDGPGERGALVVDYKTSKVTVYKGLSGENAASAFAGGTMLQLGLYAEAARAHLGVDHVESYYWLLSGLNGATLRGFCWTDELRGQFLELLGQIVEGIEDGLFPMVPGAWDSYRSTHQNCRYCAFDTICPRERGDRAEVKLADPQLRSRLALVGTGDDQP